MGNLRMPQAIADVISGMGIGIGTDAADSIRYRAPAWYRSNPNLGTIAQLHQAIS